MKPVSEVPMQHGTPVVVKHGPTYTDKRTLETILRWCDRGGEEPEGLRLHEIEQICRKQLGLELLKLADVRPESENKAAKWRAKQLNGDGKPDGTSESLARCAIMLDEYAPDLFPANELGQVPFARVMMESVADEIRAFLKGGIAMTVRAKMTVQSVEGNVLTMGCQYDPEVKAEDRSFMQATPWGELRMGIDNPKALEQFTPGKVFYVDFVPVQQ